MVCLGCHWLRQCPCPRFDFANSQNYADGLKLWTRYLPRRSTAALAEPVAPDKNHFQLPTSSPPVKLIPHDQPRFHPQRLALRLHHLCAAHIKGDEKGEAQIFLDRLFQAFGHKGLKEAGAELEMRVKKTEEGGTAFADLVWKPIVLIEMKKRGADLNRHYRQAFDYWIRLVPGRPSYVVLCNSDEFWVYDFEIQPY